MIIMKNKYEFYRGKPNTKYGIWNNVTKKFQFGICEDSPALAEARLFYLIGDDARKWRFEPKKLPQKELDETEEITNGN